MDTTKVRAESKAEEIKSSIEKINARIEKSTLEIRSCNSEKLRLQQHLDLLNEIIGEDTNHLQDYKSKDINSITIEGEVMTDKIINLLQQYGSMISADIVKRLGASEDNDKFTVHNAIKKLLREGKIRQVELLKANGERQKRNVPLTINS